MPTDPQPEEAATRPLAAAASAAGSFTQTKMYGRGFRQRPDSTEKAGEPTPGQQKPPQQPPGSLPQAQAPAGEPGVWGDVPQPPAAAAGPLDRLTRSWDDPDLDAEIPAGGAAAEVAEQDVAAQVDEPVVSGEMRVACSGQDAAAARARLVQGQQVEPPPVAPPAPGIGPGL